MNDSPIFPIITESNHSQLTNNKRKLTLPRKTRWDKTHSMKFPVSLKQEKELRILWKKHKLEFERIEERPVSITKFNTILLRYGLRNRFLINEHPYKDSGTYKTVKPNQIEYELIGGINGLAIQFCVSERKALYYVMESVLSYLRSGGRLDYESTKPIKPFEQRLEL